MSTVYSKFLTVLPHLSHTDRHTILDYIDELRETTVPGSARAFANLESKISLLEGVLSLADSFFWPPDESLPDEAVVIRAMHAAIVPLQSGRGRAAHLWDLIPVGAPYASWDLSQFGDAPASGAHR